MVDLVAARPIHLAIIEGVKSMSGGEGPWVKGDLKPVSPGLLVAGLNPVDYRCGRDGGHGVRPDGGSRHAAVRRLRQHARIS
ncbi:MAG: hypothetical protein WDO73_23210 [Ignavibacteriota bacterium]